MKRKLFFLLALILGLVSSIQARTDVTSTYLTNADLSSLTGWTNPSRTDWKTDGAVNVVEFWNYSTQFDFEQNVTLPAGYYRLAVNAFYRNGWTGDGTNDNMAWIFAGDKKQNVVALNSMSELSGYAGSNDLYRAATAFSQGKFSNEFDFDLASESTIALGFKGTCPGGGWCILGPVKLYEYTAEDYIADYRVKVAEAEALYDTPMNADVLQALKDAVVDEATLVTVDDVTNAIAALNTAIGNANTSIGVYSSINTAIGAYATKAAALDASGAAAYDDSAIQAKYNNGTYETLAEAEADCQAALVVAVKSQTTPGSDWTGLISNPSFEENTGGFQAPIGWTCEGTDNGIQTQNNNGFDGYRVGNMFAERWSGGTVNDFDAYQIINDMPAGVYELKAVATFNGTGGYLYANEVKANITDAKYYTVSIALDENADLKIGVKNETSGNGSWFKCDNFTLTLVSAGLPDVTPVEGKMNTAVAQAQNEAVAAYNANKTVANYNAAVAAIAAAQASVDAYAAANAAIETAEALLVDNNFVTTAAATTFAEAVEGFAVPYENGTLTNEEAANAGRALGVVAVGWHAEATNTPASNYMMSTWPANLTLNDWSVEGETDGSNYLVPFFQDWIGDGESLATKTWTGTLTGLENGTYEVSAWIRVRAKNGTAASAATGITMNVNGGEAVDVTEGVVIGTSQFQLATYTATGYVTDGTLSVKFDIANGNNISWLAFKNVKYTRTGDVPAADAADYAALIAVATTVKNNVTAGFLAGQYAPYNNTALVAAAKTAYAIVTAYQEDPSVIYPKTTVQAATAALQAAYDARVINDEEVNAIYNGDFSLSTNDGAQAGWQTDHSAGLGGAFHARAFVLTSGMTNYDNLAAFGQGDATRSCSYFRFDGTNSARTTKYTYGATEGYTMPLNTGTIYKLTAQAGGWGQVDKNFQIAVVSSTDENVVAQNLKTPTTGVHVGGPVIDYEMYFVVPAAGDYKLVLNNPNDVDNAIVISNIELKSANTLMFEEDDNLPTYAPGTYPNVTLGRIIKEGINTVVLPFSMTQEDVENYFGEGSKVYIVDTYNQSKENITFATQDGIIANRPCLLKATEQGISYEIANCTVDAASAAPEYVGTHVSMIGNYAPTFVVPENANNYVISGGKFIFVNTDDVTMRGTRAYIKLADGNNARELVMILDDDPTAINSIEASEEAGALKDGKYFINGRIVIVNNGLVFGANGQLLK